MAYEVRLSVRALVEFLMREGSIDSRFSGTDRAAEGSRLHRMLQKQEKAEDYRAEVPLSLTTERNGIAYTLEGRADGVLRHGDFVTVDEIKTTAVPASRITEDMCAAHWGQAMCYAYILAKKEDLQTISVRLTYYQVDTELLVRFTRDFSFAALETFYLGLLQKYEVWAVLKRDWCDTRNKSIGSLRFPFSDYRPGQRPLAAAIYRTIAAKGRLFCQAPTGTGKTISTLFPAIKAMGEGKGEKLFYLTAKTITRQAAEEALFLMREQGLRLKTVTLTAKDKICFQEKPACMPETCAYADGHYNRVLDALYALIQENNCITRETVEQAARRFRVCPFELALDATLWCDGIVCDYNYLFDPVVYLKRFFAEGKGDYIFLIDEAHNLADRAREMYSATLCKAAFWALRKILGKDGKPLYGALGKLNKEFVRLRAACEETEQGELDVKEIPKELLFQLTAACTAFQEWLAEHKESPLLDEVLPAYFELRFFLKIAELYDGHYITYIRTAGTDVSVRLLCLDPSALLDACMKKGRSAILFSATLTPLSYYMSVLGGEQNAKRCALPSPFPQSRMGLWVAEYISTKYANREHSLTPVSELLYTFIQGRQGNYLVYFPSYRYLKDVYETFHAQYPEVETLIQTGRMEETEREAFLAQFRPENKTTLVGFCVLGGIYSEGVDLKGNRLIGTAIVGVGLPQLSRELDLLKEYYEQERGEGYAYAYRYPGMNKVLQAGGRVIRSETDKGAVLLIDERFTTADYRALFPEHWRHCRAVRGKEALQRELESFWNAPD